MIRRVKIAAFVITSMIGITVAGLHAQEQIHPADSARPLRMIWMTRGSVNPGNEQIGFGTAGLGDISGDGIGDFAVEWAVDGRWRAYYGADSAPGTVPVWISDSMSDRTIAAGDYWGTGHRALCIGYVYDNPGHSAYYYGLRIYRTEKNAIDSVASLNLATDLQTAGVVYTSSDLDGDGSDELIWTRYGLSQIPEVLIYRGGPDFQISEPTLVLHDPEQVVADQQRYLVVGDFDGDHRPDILTGGTYRAGQQLKFWFSSMHSSVWEWDQPDRVVTLVPDLYPGFGLGPGITAVDCDGDHVLDLVLPSSDGSVFTYLSKGSGKSVLTRSFSKADADRTFTSLGNPRPVGYLNDSSRHYGMFGAEAGDQQGSRILAMFSGGESGPDAAYDAFYAPDADGIDGMIFQYDTPLMDVNGDGWSDYLAGFPNWHAAGVYKPGIAMILAGGPNIPHDTTWAEVREVACESKINALSIWPIPAHDELHIAWRGDLSRMPARFEVRDVLGRLTAEGSAESWRGAVVWNCAAEPPGVYLLAVLDRNGSPIATADILKK